jgi:uncharacterized protein (DUF1800 family)
MKSTRFDPSLRSSGEHAKVAVAALLCVLMVDQPLLAMGEPAKAAKTPSAATEMQGQTRVLHALNRLTFGPKPGDVAAVQAMGLNKWFEMQLNPGSIDDSGLDARLAQFPAMQLSQAQLEAKYPGNQMLKAISEGKVALPSDPTQRLMVEDQLALYKKLQKKQEAAAANTAALKAADGGNGMMAAQTPGGDMAASVPPAAMGPVKKQKAIQSGLSTLMSDDSDPMANKPLPAAAVSAADPMMNEDAPDPGARANFQRIVALPADQRMQAILQLKPSELAGMRQSLQGPQLARLVDGMNPEQKERLTALSGGTRMIALEAMESRLLRDVYSDRQLEAVMTDFWLNHFNVYVRKNQNEPYLLPSYERETIRPHALGKFEDLLVATAKSPAMLVYLDNFRSVGPDSMQAKRLAQAKNRFPNAPLVKQAAAGLNENYGRELMELHTLGVGNYTQADVTNVAKVFTGWGLDKPQDGESYQFEERRHEPGEKVVLGKTIKENGENEGMEVLHMLATSPATAHFISQKLAIRFVSDNPPAALVDKMAASFTVSDGDIKTVLRTMFNAPEFWSPAVLRAKVKTPQEFMISALRASGAQVMNPQPLVQALEKLGMPLYGMQTPNGYSWTQEGWVSTGALVSRMNFSLVLSGDKLPGTRTQWADLLNEKPGVEQTVFSTTGGMDPALVKEKRLELLLLGQPVSERTRETVLAQSTDQTVTDQAATQFDLQGGGKGNKGDYAARGIRGMRPGGPPDDPQAAVMAGLLLGSPEFQRR